MPVAPYSPPTYDASAFNCPHCHAYSTISWAPAAANWRAVVGVTNVRDIDFARCGHCNKWSIWYEKEMIYPKEVTVEDPNPDLPEGVRKDYLEAAVIMQDSPKGSGALLRLALQKLIDGLVDGPDDLNAKIGTLVSQGLDSKIQQALDIVRVIGNEAVHPGQINLDDSPQIVEQLFKLINLIAQKMITEPNEIAEMYSLLPSSKKAGIERRDGLHLSESPS